MIKVGEVSYTEEVFGDKKFTNNKDLFLKLSNGSNELRIVTAPFQYLVHKYKKEGDPGFGQKVQCSMLNGSCPLCETTDDKAKPRYFYGVIDRKTGSYKVLDATYSVFMQIKKLANSKSWGNPQLYDIDVIIDSKCKGLGYYSVQPLPKEPLSASDQVLKDNADLDDLKRRCQAPTAEQVQKRIDKINGTTPDAPVSKTAAAASAEPVAPKVQPVNMEPEEGDDDFPDYAAT